ncbi:MAG TPA: DUF5667 domain-containing protein [Mycobacteriales bacterium]|nr:DUF5667 domain-containing protein [Mycobacteriales bacterium]
MNTLTSRRAAERFSRLIELDVPPLFLDGGDREMQPAVALTSALRSAGRTAAPAPLSAAARLAMRERLVAAASTSAEASLLAPTLATRVGETAARAKDASRHLGRRASALVGSIVILTSVSGVGVAAARSLPGSPFYDIKRATEGVQLWLAHGSAAKGERHLEFARTRLAEARALGADSSHVASTLTAMNQETREGSADLIKAYRTSGDNDPLATLVTFTRRQYADLARFSDSAGTKVQAQAFYSLTLLTGVAQEVESVSGTTCLSCLVTGNPTGKPTPGVSHSPSPVPSTSSPGSSPSGTPRQTPTSLLPTNLLPTQLPTQLPTKVPTKLPSLLPGLGDHNGKATKPGKLVPTLSPLPLLSSLTNLLTDR